MNHSYMLCWSLLCILELGFPVISSSTAADFVAQTTIINATWTINLPQPDTLHDYRGNCHILSCTANGGCGNVYIQLVNNNVHLAISLIIY